MSEHVENFVPRLVMMRKQLSLSVVREIQALIDFTIVAGWQVHGVVIPELLYHKQMFVGNYES